MTDFQDYEPSQNNESLSHANTAAGVAGSQEMMLDGLEMDFIQKLLPKGFSLTTTLRPVRNRTLKTVAAAEQIEPMIPEFKEEPQRRARPGKETRFRQLDPFPKFHKHTSDMMKKCFKVLSQLQKQEAAYPFLKPVDYVALGIPDYPDIIKEPIDLSKVEKRLRTGAYKTPLQFAADVRKIWSNAILYNKPDSPIYELTVRMSDFFEAKIKDVEENPFPDQVNEYIHLKVTKIEKKLADLKAAPLADHSRPLSIEQKKQLMQLLGGTPHSSALPTEHLAGVLKLLQEHQQPLPDCGELSLDLATLPGPLLSRLYRYVKSKSDLLERLKKKQLKDKLRASLPPGEDGFVGHEASRRKNTEDEEDLDNNQSDSSYFTNLDSDGNELV
jgi:Bromodomain/Bromodomain extra-terminal - transcription regulation